jgi:hypothetical protein
VVLEIAASEGDGAIPVGNAIHLLTPLDELD